MSVYVQLQALAFVLLTVFLAYVATILVPYLRRRPDAWGNPNLYSWHVFVPCRNEEAVIGSSLRRLRSRFPEAHVWVIDDASDDATGSIIAAAGEVDDHVHLVQRVLPEAQTGKGDALNAAYRALLAWLPEDADHDRVIVTVVDADGDLAEDAMAIVASDDVFGNPVVGAAQCQVAMFEAPPDASRFARLLRALQDAEFRTTIAAMQMLRGHTISVGLGGNGQFSRLSALDVIGDQAGEPWHGSLLEDYELSLHMMLAGYEIRYVHDAVVSQEAVASLPALVKQRTRWCQGGIQCLRYLREVAGSPHVTPAATVEMSYFLTTPIQTLVGIVVWPIVLIGMAILGAQSAGGLLPWIVASWWLLPLILLTGIAPFATWGYLYGRERGWNLLRCVGFGLTYWLYSYLTQVYVLNAFRRLALRQNGWVKTARLKEVGLEAGTVEVALESQASSAAAAGSAVADLVPTAARASFGARTGSTHARKAHR
ncbi:MAG: glycosyltransferase family 2 protein [Mobilicoccus sp.]|nr:glycosyltransferase family 2 protein [Mobilicoccus sp.]